MRWSFAFLVLNFIAKVFNPVVQADIVVWSKGSQRNKWVKDKIENFDKNNTYHNSTRKEDIEHNCELTSIESALRVLNEQLRSLVNESHFNYIGFEAREHSLKKEVGRLERTFETLCDNLKATRNTLTAMTDAAQRFQHYSIPIDPLESYLNGLTVIELRAMSLHDVDVFELEKNVTILERAAVNWEIAFSLLESVPEEMKSAFDSQLAMTKQAIDNVRNT